MNNIGQFFNDDPWEEVREPSYPDGRRLYLNDNRFWVSMDSSRNLVFFIHEHGISARKSNNNFSSVNVDISEYGDSQSRFVCTLLDDDEDAREKFSIVAKDVAHSCSGYSGNQLFSKALDRIQSWSEFLKPRRSGLSDSEYLGFFGELFFFNKFILKAFNPDDSVKFWVGPEQKKQDFTFNSLAIDIKSTMSGDSNIIKISSLDQLDRITEHLYLLRLIFNPASTNSGSCLSQMYKECIEYLDYDLDAKSQFLFKTSAIFGNASDEQLEKSLLLTNQEIYRVTDDFPCLTRNKVSYEIADVSYSIYASRISNYLVEKDIEEIISSG